MTLVVISTHMMRRDTQAKACGEKRAKAGKITLYLRLCALMMISGYKCPFGEAIFNVAAPFRVRIEAQAKTCGYIYVFEGNANAPYRVHFLIDYNLCHSMINYLYLYGGLIGTAPIAHEHGPVPPIVQDIVTVAAPASVLPPALYP